MLLFRNTFLDTYAFHNCFIYLMFSLIIYVLCLFAFQEAGSINKSLSVLGNVIMALVQIANGKNRYVPYRDSKLSFLLRVSGASFCVRKCSGTNS